MDRINDASAPNKTFLDADLLAGVQGTIVRALFMQDLQEELIGGLIEDAGLAPASGAGHQRLIQAGVKRLRGFNVVVRGFLSSQTYTPTAGLFGARVQLQGGGGGGGGALGAPAYNTSAAGGGAGGGYTEKFYTAAQLGASAAIVIGAAGAGAAAAQVDGGAGGSSSFSPAGGGAVLYANGGTGGYYGPTYQYPNRGNFIAGGGPGAGGDINTPGQPGEWGMMWGGSTAYAAASGRGGNSVLGVGGQSAQENAQGNVGQGYGGGGGGGAATTASMGGGNGAAGTCIITEYVWTMP